VEGCFGLGPDRLLAKYLRPCKLAIQIRCLRFVLNGAGSSREPLLDAFNRPGILDPSPALPRLARGQDFKERWKRLRRRLFRSIFAPNTVLVDSYPCLGLQGTKLQAPLGQSALGRSGCFLSAVLSGSFSLTAIIGAAIY